MRVKSVIQDDYKQVWYDRFVVTFEHDGIEWIKYVQDPLDKERLFSLLNSVIEDTIVRCR